MRPCAQWARSTSKWMNGRTAGATAGSQPPSSPSIDECKRVAGPTTPRPRRHSTLGRGIVPREPGLQEGVSGCGMYCGESLDGNEAVRARALPARDALKVVEPRSC